VLLSLSIPAYPNCLVQKFQQTIINLNLSWDHAKIEHFSMDSASNSAMPPPQTNACMQRIIFNILLKNRSNNIPKGWSFSIHFYSIKKSGGLCGGNIGSLLITCQFIQVQLTLWFNRYLFPFQQINICQLWKKTEFPYKFNKCSFLIMKCRLSKLWYLRKGVC
jgi:hypothetical protein